MTALEAVEAVALELAAAGVPSPRVDAEHLVTHVLGTSRTGLHTAATAVDTVRLRALVDRRRNREPLAYVLGEWGFRRLVLGVDERVLVPRPETEVVVERCLARIRELERPRVLDVGTGSGAIALSVADEHARAIVTAVDASPGALAVARANAVRAGLEERVRFLAGDGLAGLDGSFDLVVSNPPYVAPEELASLEPEVRDWEPREALLDEGMGEAIAADARRVLAPGGWLVLECAAHRTIGVAALLRTLGYADVAVTRDLAGRERVVEGRFDG
jgi:release factor glutamine methyltransferase